MWEQIRATVVSVLSDIRPMPRPSLRAFILLTALLAFLAPPAFAARLALVIGNDSYRNVPPLRNARTDASSMARALGNNGFKVTLLRDLDQRGFKAGLDAFSAAVSEGDDVVFFYAGHGVQLGITNYLLPVDTRAASDAQLREQAIPVQRVLDDMRAKKARFTLTILDACRDNPFQGSSINGLAAGQGLAPTMASTGQMIIYSAGSGQQALDQLGSADRDPNGVFTRVFLKELERPGQPVDRMMRSIRSEVNRMARSVGHEQVPALYDQSLGDFFFRQAATTAQAAQGTAAARMPSIAFGGFAGESDNAALVPRIVGSDLERSGRFRLVDAAGIQMSDSRRPDAAVWAARDVNFVVGGSVQPAPDGRIDVRYRAWNLQTGEQLAGESFVIERRDVRLAAHRISDRLQQEITGVPGSFSVRAAKVTSMAGRYELMISDSDGANVQQALRSPKPIALPTWGGDGVLAYLSLESGEPTAYVQTLKTGGRKIATTSAQVVSACAGEIAALRRADASLDDWLKDDWRRGAASGCASAMAAAAQER